MEQNLLLIYRNKLALQREVYGRFIDFECASHRVRFVSRFGEFMRFG